MQPLNARALCLALALTAACATGRPAAAQGLSTETCVEMVSGQWGKWRPQSSTRGFAGWRLEFRQTKSDGGEMIGGPPPEDYHGEWHVRVDPTGAACVVDFSVPPGTWASVYFEREKADGAFTSPVVISQNDPLHFNSGTDVGWTKAGPPPHARTPTPEDCDYLIEGQWDGGDMFRGRAGRASIMLSSEGRLDVLDQNGQPIDDLVGQWTAEPTAGGCFVTLNEPPQLASVMDPQRVLFGQFGLALMNRDEMRSSDLVRWRRISGRSAPNYQ